MPGTFINEANIAYHTYLNIDWEKIFTTKLHLYLQHFYL